MRVLIDLEERPEGWYTLVTGPGWGAIEKPVRWAGGRRLLVSAAEQITDQEATALADVIDRGGAGAAEAERYGRLLFEAAFGPRTWRVLVAAAHGQPWLELAVRGSAAGDDGQAAALQALRWEAIHDGTTHVAARGIARPPADGPPGQHRVPLPVAIVRLVNQSVPGRPGTDWLPPISRLPRVLFAIGSRLTDPRVRPGAEFMGILRHLERNGGSIQPRLAESASVPSLTAEVRRFQPDVLHLIGHGRWFARDDRVRLQLRAESGEEDSWAGAEELLGVFEEAAHVPDLVVLSACQGASGGAGTDRSLNALPLAGQLVAGGVPVVVAMAGDISDTACRVFTRALTQAIGDGVPLVDAAIRGRTAAFRHRPDHDSTDWMLPAIFLAEDLPGTTTLVDTAAIDMVRQRLHALELAHDPVFCGRREFVAAMDLLLDEAEPLNVLVACTPDAGSSYGGLRLLQELAARTVRAGHLPVLLGPYDQGQPTDHVRFAKDLSGKLAEIRDNLGLPDVPDDIVARAREYTDLADKPVPLARAIRAAFRQLAEDLGTAWQQPRPRVVLLCHRVDKWGDALRPLLAMLGAPGLSPGQEPVPVVLTGTDTAELAELRQAKSGAAWVDFLPLGRFRSDEDDPEDILAYQWWLLNPYDKKTPVYAPRRGVEDWWQDDIRLLMKERPLYARTYLLEFAKLAVKRGSFTADMDEDILDSYARAVS